MIVTLLNVMVESTFELQTTEFTTEIEYRASKYVWQLRLCWISSGERLPSDVPTVSW